MGSNCTSNPTWAMVFVYKEQEAWVRWGPLRTKKIYFISILLNPSSVYLVDLLLELGSYMDLVAT